MVKITKLHSPNFGERKDGKVPRYIILHYTATKDTKTALDDYLMNPAAEVSSHYLIEKDGNILQLVEDEKRAWHAGKSFWEGETDLNSASIGIEIVNLGPPEVFADEQIESTIALCQILMKKWNIPGQNILGHSDIAPDRKVDPGPLFPWNKLTKLGIVRNT